MFYNFFSTHIRCIHNFQSSLLLKFRERTNIIFFHTSNWSFEIIPFPRTLLLSPTFAAVHVELLCIEVHYHSSKTSCVEST